MKTTIEVKGYQLVIDETEEMVTVTATSLEDDEVVEEFSLELTDGEVQADEEEIKGFDDFEEEGDFEDDFEEGENFDEDDDDDDDEQALESFQTFINKRKK